MLKIYLQILRSKTDQFSFSLIFPAPVVLGCRLSTTGHSPHRDRLHFSRPSLLLLIVAMILIDTDSLSYVPPLTC